MKLVEYKAKEIFRNYGIPVPDGITVNDTIVPDGLNYPVALKSQVLIGGRGKAGGIQFAKNREEADEKLSKIMGMDIKGYTVKEVLIEPMLNIKKELYLSITIDRDMKCPVVLACAEGGMEIESVADEKILRLPINPLAGYSAYMGRILSDFFGLSGTMAKQASSILENLYRAFSEKDAELLEINPLIITGGGNLIAGDGKAEIDEAAIFRQKEYDGLNQELTSIEKKAQDSGIAFVQLDGNLGILANGAGLTMATIDEVNFNGGSAGVFLDLGGTDDSNKVRQALELMAEAKPDAVLMNIFGGLTRCDTVAKGLIDALKVSGISFPMAVRIKGANEEEGIRILKEGGISVGDDIRQVAEKAIKLANGGA